MNERHLVQDDPLIVNRDLACAFGLNNSIIFRQLWWWINGVEKKKSQHHFHEGKYWIFNSYASWTDKDNFPFWHRDTVRAGLNELEELGIVLAGNFNRRAGDNTKWYTISWPVYDLFIAYWRKNGSPTCGNGKKSDEYKAFIGEYYAVLDEWQRTPPLVKVSQAPYESFISALGNYHRPLPENTTENTTITFSDAPAPEADAETSPPSNVTASTPSVSQPKSTKLRRAAPSDTHPLRRQYAEDGSSPNPFKAILTGFWMGKPTVQVTHSDISGVSMRFTGKDGLFAKGSAFEQLYDERGGFTPEQLQAAVDKWIKQNKDWDVAKRPGHTKLYAHIVPLMPSASKKKSRWEPVFDEAGNVVAHREVEE